MKKKHLFGYIFLFVLALSLIISVPQDSLAEVSEVSPSDLTEDNFNFAEFSNLLFVLWFISWLVESFLEIIQKVFKIEQNSNLKKDDKPSPVIARWTAIGGFLVGVIVFLSGLHIVETLFDFLQETEPIHAGLFKFIDAVLTASVIAGGSQGIHKLTNAYKGIMQVIQGSTPDKLELQSSPQSVADTKLN